MEQPTSFENENIEQELIRKALSLGINNPEVQMLLQKWTDEKETEANEINTPRANVELNLKRTKLFWAMGLKDLALENLQDVWYQVAQEQLDDLCDEICDLWDKIDPEER